MSLFFFFIYILKEKKESNNLFITAKKSYSRYRVNLLDTNVYGFERK
jgi:hypothetical protein